MGNSYRNISTFIYCTKGHNKGVVCSYRSYLTSFEFVENHAHILKNVIVKITQLD